MMQNQVRSEDAIIERGRAAWDVLKDARSPHIGEPKGASPLALAQRKKAQAERLRLWLDLGQALAFGKRVTRTGHAYHEWLKVNGFEFVQQAARANAVWFANNAASIGEIPVGITSPATLRLWLPGRAKLAAARRDDGGASQPSAGSMPVPDVAAVVATASVQSAEIAGMLREAAESLQYGAALMLKASQAMDQDGRRD